LIALLSAAASVANLFISNLEKSWPLLAGFSLMGSSILPDLLELAPAGGGDHDKIHIQSSP